MEAAQTWCRGRARAAREGADCAPLPHNTHLNLLFPSCPRALQVHPPYHPCQSPSGSHRVTALLTHRLWTQLCPSEPPTFCCQQEMAAAALARHVALFAQPLLKHNGQSWLCSPPSSASTPSVHGRTTGASCSPPELRHPRELAVATGPGCPQGSPCHCPAGPHCLTHPS